MSEQPSPCKMTPFILLLKPVHGDLPVWLWKRPLPRCRDCRNDAHNSHRTHEEDRIIRIDCSTEVRLLEVARAHGFTWAKVMTPDGTIGYVRGAFVGDAIDLLYFRTENRWPRWIGSCPHCLNSWVRADVDGIPVIQTQYVSGTTAYTVAAVCCPYCTTILEFKKRLAGNHFSLSPSCNWDIVDGCVRLSPSTEDQNHSSTVESKEQTNVRERLVTLLKTLQSPIEGLNHMFISPTIPPKKSAKARGSCRVPETEEIIGLLDCTSWGSAKNALLFGREGIYYRNGFAAPVLSGPGSLKYSDLPNRILGIGEKGEVVLLGNRQRVYLGGIRALGVVAILMFLQDVAAQGIVTIS